MLPDDAARGLAGQVAAALQAQEVPAVATDTPLPLDWRVEIVAERQGEAVLPRFRLLDADRRPAGGGGRRAGAAARLGGAHAGGAGRAWRPRRRRPCRGSCLQVEAARKATDPASLTAGPPRIRVAGVRGAPGDGNTALAARIRDLLGHQGFVVQDSAEGAGYALEAEVAVTPPARGVQRVEIHLDRQPPRRRGTGPGGAAQRGAERAPQPLLGRHRLRRRGGSGGRRADGGGERPGRAAGGAQHAARRRARRRGRPPHRARQPASLVR